MGLVQPASAILYDYYSPGEHLGCFGKHDCKGLALSLGTPLGRGGLGSKRSSCLAAFL